MKHNFRFTLVAMGGISASLYASDVDTALLVRDSVIDPTAHYFPSITFGVPTVHGVTFQQEGVVTHRGWQSAVKILEGHE